MNTQVQAGTSPGDILKWLVAAAVLVAGLVVFYVFAEQSLLLRVVGVLVCMGAAAAIGSQTEHGRVALAFFKESRTEVRKVVWPTRSETTQTTIIVVIMVAVVAVFLWILDTILGWLIRLLLDVGA